MKLTIVNGSPRHGKSNSGLLIELLLQFIQEKNEVNITHVENYKSVDKYIDEIVKADMLVFAFPLYVDSIPSHILYLMERISENHRNNNLIIYVIMNNGFYEGKQNHIAIQQMKLWCCDNGFVWGQGIGCGAGEMLPFLKKVPLGHGPTKNLGDALEAFAININRRGTGEELYINPNWPRFMWKYQANRMYWIPKAKKNGLKKKDIFKK